MHDSRHPDPLAGRYLIATDPTCKNEFVAVPKSPVTNRSGKSMIAACDPGREKAAQAVTVKRDPGGIDVAARQQIVHPAAGRSLDMRRESVFVHGFTARQINQQKR